jgi:hypothetical protein
MDAFLVAFHVSPNFVQFQVAGSNPANTFGE